MSPAFLIMGGVALLGLFAASASAKEGPGPGPTEGTSPDSWGSAYHSLSDAEKIALLKQRGLPITADPALAARVQQNGGVVKTPLAESASKKAAPKPVMSTRLQEAFANALRALTVDAEGNITGPVTKEAIRLATQTAGRLDRKGFPDAAKTLREFAKKAAALVPPPKPAEEVPMPPQMPPELQKRVNRMLQNERDPEKLQALVDALKPYAKTPEGKKAIQMIKALIVNIEVEEANREALEKADEVIKTPTGAKTLPDLDEEDTVTTWKIGANSRVIIIVQPDGSVTADRLISQLKSQVPDLSNIKKVSGGKVSVIAFNDDDTPFKIGPSFLRDEFKVNGTIVSVRPYSAPEEILAEPEVVQVPPTPVPQPEPPPKSPVQQAAEAMAAHLKSVQKRYGMPGAKGQEDKSVVIKFQKLAGITADGAAGPGTLGKAATYGVGDLPLVMYWPRGSNLASVQTYRDTLRRLADEAEAQGRADIANQLRMVASYESGQAGVAQYGATLS